jgi:hypothetical protein
MLTLKDNDFALVIRPNIIDGGWNQTVDINILAMPAPDLSVEGKEDLMYMINGLVACFHLLNVDGVFQNKVHAYMSKMEEEEARTAALEGANTDNVIQLDRWTKTKGSA